MKKILLCLCLMLVFGCKDKKRDYMYSKEYLYERIHENEEAIDRLQREVKELKDSAQCCHSRKKFIKTENFSDKVWFCCDDCDQMLWYHLEDMTDKQKKAFYLLGVYGEPNEVTP